MVGRWAAARAARAAAGSDVAAAAAQPPAGPAGGPSGPHCGHCCRQLRADGPGAADDLGALLPAAAGVCDGAPAAAAARLQPGAVPAAGALHPLERSEDARRALERRLPGAPFYAAPNWRGAAAALPAALERCRARSANVQNALRITGLVRHIIEELLQPLTSEEQAALAAEEEERRAAAEAASAARNAQWLRGLGGGSSVEGGGGSA